MPSQLSSVMGKEIHEDRSPQELDMSDWMSRVALESVGRTVLGYSFDPLDSPHNNPYTSAVKELMYVANIYHTNVRKLKIDF